MTVLSDFQKLHLEAKAFLMGLVFIAPFWFIDLFLFHKTFFNTHPIYLSIVFSYCLSIVYLIPCLIAAFFLAMGLFKDNAEMETVYYLTIFFGVLILAFMTAISYGAQDDFFSFIDLLIQVIVWFFTLCAVFYVVMLIIREIKKRKKTKEDTKSEGVDKSEIKEQEIASTK